MAASTPFSAMDVLDKETDNLDDKEMDNIMEYTATTNNNVKTYIITGGSGFLGSHIVEHLLHDNHNVIVLDNKYPTTEILLQIEQAKSSKFVLCDITRYKDVYRAFNIFKNEKDSDTDSHHSHSSTSSTSSSSSSNSSTSKSKLNPNSIHIDCVFHCAALTDPWAHR